MSLDLATKEELRALSGRTRQSAIRRWLDEQGIAYLPDADGWPKVLRSSLLDRQPAAPQTQEPQVHPV